ncbi:MAG: hypothetical protein K2K72_02260, partial [Duncaniella sp.]|nr:hypothetical protein [Duncaniella sp.]
MASWTFEGGYASSSQDDGKTTVLTPGGSDYADVSTVWFNASAPLVRPDECVGTKTDYALTALSKGRYWTVCTG